MLGVEIGWVRIKINFAVHGHIAYQIIPNHLSGRQNEQIIIKSFILRCIYSLKCFSMRDVEGDAADL